MTDSCGAKTRNGGECKKAPIKGRNRCKFHGGKSTGAITHGIYQKHFTQNELDNLESFKLAKIDDELLLTRVRLSRALAAESLANGAPELEEVTENDGGGVAVPRETRKSKVKDYHSIIDRLTARIESLEKTRLILLDKDGISVNDVTEFETVPYED